LADAIVLGVELLLVLPASRGRPGPGGLTRAWTCPGRRTHRAPRL